MRMYRIGLLQDGLSRCRKIRYDSLQTIVGDCLYHFAGKTGCAGQAVLAIS